VNREIVVTGRQGSNLRNGFGATGESVQYFIKCHLPTRLVPGLISIPTRGTGGARGRGSLLWRRVRPLTVALDPFDGGLRPGF